MINKAAERVVGGQQMPDIVPAAAADLEVLVRTLSSAFRYDPLVNWLLPDTRVYPALFRLILTGSSLPRGMVHRDREGRGAALWLPPAMPFELPLGWPLMTLFVSVMRRSGPGTLRRLRQQATLFARHRPAGPHFHLQFIGCRQGQQGRGVGAQLLKTGTRACDARQSPAYLECSNPLNLPLYERHGFVIQGEATLPDCGPRVWFMWRETMQI